MLMPFLNLKYSFIFKYNVKYIYKEDDFYDKSKYYS